MKINTAENKDLLRYYQERAKRLEAINLAVRDRVAGRYIRKSQKERRWTCIARGVDIAFVCSILCLISASIGTLIGR